MFRVIGALLFLVSPVFAVTYFISPSGNDSNSGLDSNHPWLSPKHNLNCGDTILASAGTYAEGNFRLGNWGIVSCPSANNVAWLKCVTFDTCKIIISTASHDALGISQSFWGVQGWEVTVSTPSTNQCFQTYPPDNSTQIHHIIFANNIANGCGDGGITIGAATATVGVDYAVIVGNIVYNSAQGSDHCYSGIDVVFPVNSDTVAGTHIYIAGNYVWGVVDPNPCQGGAPTDGQGILLDSLNLSGYSGQIVIDNNISIFNGATGFQNFSSSSAPVYVRNNTFYGNQTGSVNANPCAEINISGASHTDVFMNLSTASTNTCLNGVNEYALGSSFDDTSDIFNNNFIYSAGGFNTNTSNAIVTNNISGSSPFLSKTAVPLGPNCGNSTSVPSCMSSLISSSTPSNPNAKPYGYQTPSSTPIVDPLFPAWLCGVTNLPSGLITMGCASPSRQGPSSMGDGLSLANGASIQ